MGTGEPGTRITLCSLRFRRSHIKYLLDLSGTGVNIMVVEKDPAFARDISRFDLSKILSNDRILGTGEPNDEFFTPTGCRSDRSCRDQ